MDTINNFITDLLEEMLNSKAHTLKLRPGHKPSFQDRGQSQFIPGYAETRFDELVADFEALGITGLNDPRGKGRSIMTFTQEPHLPPKQFSITYKHEYGALHITISQTKTSKTAIGSNL
jgi:hypothetical protein